jgi:uncharacterized protein (TIGR00725 family)
MAPVSTRKVAILGSSSAREDSPLGRKAYRIGCTIGARGAVVLTGGCPGLPHAAALGAMEAGGQTVAVSPALNRGEHVSVYGYPDDSRILICTGMGKTGRNVILIRSADACVFMGGGIGTLNEFTVAFHELGSAAAIGLLLDGGGIVDELPGIVASLGSLPSASLVKESEPERLVELIMGHICD